MLNKTALITGAARGIGGATMELFAENGAETIYAVDILGDELIQNAKRVTDKYTTQIVPVILDVTDSEARKDLFMRILNDSGKLDVLVNCAGVAMSKLIEMSSEVEMYRCFEVNALATLGYIQSATRLMKKNKLQQNGGNGSIINISSIAGVFGNRGQIAYSGAKAAVIGITKTAAKELAPFQIRVNAIAPGTIDTAMLHTLSDDIIADMLADVGMARLGQPEEIAEAILFFASDKSSYVTGQILGVDGGFIM
jgi:3-oxoacyl-[acyl-carrier protein] reductase